MKGKIVKKIIYVLDFITKKEKKKTYSCLINVKKIDYINRRGLEN